MEELIAKRYAKALTQVSKDIEKSAVLLERLSESIENKEVKQVLTSPLLTNDKKIEIVLSGLGEHADSTLVHFIKVLGENKRLELIPFISQVLNRDLQKKSNQYDGIVLSNKVLDAKVLDRLEKTLKTYTGASIQLKQEKSDFDGLRVLVDDLGIEVNFSKQRVKEQLIDFIKNSLS